MIAPNELAAFKALPNLAIWPATSLPRQISSLAELDALVLSFWYKLFPACNALLSPLYWVGCIL